MKEFVRWKRRREFSIVFNKGGDIMNMYKPQERHEEISIKAEYSESVKFYYGRLKPKFTEIEFEDVEHLMDEVYKDAYIDGFKDALFFTGRFFL